ncbi:MAG: type II toxin-antitoxin system HipA family toxin [Alphaproteobacteria bacterium]|nr:MAG: type II toxin-antitoxin system HipA family toxin [Alphaproteobacteria bacterium]
MGEVEVHLDLDGRTVQVGLVRVSPARNSETVSFEYTHAWLADPNRFSLEPALPTTKGVFHPGADEPLFGALGDSAPDTWGRKLMQRKERKDAKRQGRAPRTLLESDYVLGVADEARLGAVRFQRVGSEDFETTGGDRIPPLIDLGKLLDSTQRILRDVDTEDDLRLVLAPGSSLGGARPKASVRDHHGQLSIAKFPKETDDYSLETWEEISMRLAAQCGIEVPVHRLVHVNEKKVLLSHRFDRNGAARIPFLTAMAMMRLKDGVTSSYPELVDTLSHHSAHAKRDAKKLYERIAFFVMISNVDDHLRNHAFLRLSKNGWSLSPLYDINPTPTDLKPRILSTNITVDSADCSVDLLEEASEYFDLGLSEARLIIKRVAEATNSWRSVAASLEVRPSEVDRMASAFEHPDRVRALAL